MAPIRLPSNWQPRWYQKPLWRYLENGGKRAIAIWHRRAGKDDVLLHRQAVASFERVGNRWHCLPEFEQARRAIWDAVNPHTGRKRIDEAFPHELRKRTDSQTMFIEFANGSTWQLIGSDRYNATVGASPVEITYSEFALSNPSAWAYHKPMLEENGGAATFITTPRGNNHVKAMLDMARANPKWFAEVLTARDTRTLSDEQLDEALNEYQAMYGMDFGLAMFEQEYLCSFSGAMVGAYFGAEIAKAERDGRVTVVPVDESRPVHTVWDLGASWNNPIWCFQVIGKALKVVDFYLPESEDLADWCAWLAGKGYHGTDYVPHDVLTSEWGSGKTRLDTLRQHGRKPKRIPMVSVGDGLQAGRVAINAATFHGGNDDRAQRVAHGIEGLKSYRRAWDDELKTFRQTPVKDWAEHIGSAWRYMGLAWRDEASTAKPIPKPSHVVYEAQSDGRVMSNMSFRDEIEAMIARKRKGAKR